METYLDFLGFWKLLMQPVRLDDVQVSLNRDDAPSNNMKQLTDEVERNCNAKPKLEGIRYQCHDNNDEI